MAEENIIQDIKERLVRIEILLENNTCNQKAMLENVESRLSDRISVANHRIEDLEENNKWLWRTLMVLVAGGAITIITNLLSK